MSRLSRVELVENGSGEWFFRAIAKNGETVAVSEMYASREGADAEADALWPSVPRIDAPFDRSSE